MSSFASRSSDGGAMFKLSFASRDRAGKSRRTPASSFVKDPTKTKLLEKSLLEKSSSRGDGDSSAPRPAGLPSGDIAKFVVGRDERLFAAHVSVLQRSPWMQRALKSLFYSAAATADKYVSLGDVDPAAFSMVLEFLYKGDYSPRLLYDRRRAAWHVDQLDSAADPTLLHACTGELLLRETAVYCLAERFGLEELKDLALRKQALLTGIDVAVILRSLRYCYANTPATDSKLRAHFLALIVRSRKVFKRSATMQMEMNKGGSMWFDLFVAMSSCIDDVMVATPRTV